MKCAFILYANQLGGHELMSSELAAQFVEASHQVTSFLPNEIKNKQRLVDGHSNIRIEGYDSGINQKNKIGIKSFVVSSLKRFRLIWRLKSEYTLIVNCQGSFEQNWISSFFCRILAINIVSYIPYTSYPSERNAKYSYVRDKFFGALVKLPLRYIVIDDYYKKQLEERFKIKGSYILVVKNKVDVKCDSKQVKVDNLTKPLKFILPGRIYFAQKGQDLVIDAIKRFSDEELNFRFFFIGDGPDKNKLKENISTNYLSEICTIMPWQDNVNELYSSCDCVVLPSRYEGVSLVMLEAMALKKPLLASNIDINMSFIKKDFLFEAENSEDLSQKLLHIYHLLKSNSWSHEDNYNDLSNYEDSNINRNINNWISIAFDAL